MPPEAVLGDLQNIEDNNQVDMPPVEEKELRNAIRAASPPKAPGQEGISNRAFQAGMTLITAHNENLQPKPSARISSSSRVDYDSLA